jgi:hypothetical protein
MSSTHKEIQEIVLESADSTIEFHSNSSDHSELKPGADLADIYFEDDVSISTVEDLRNKFQEKEYVAKIIQKNRQVCLKLQLGHKLLERLD